jgi:hypothetical protein
MGRNARIPSLQRCQVNNVVLQFGYGCGHALGDIRNIGIERPKLVENLPMGRIVFSLQLLYSLLHCYWAQFDNATI